VGAIRQLRKLAERARDPSNAAPVVLTQRMGELLYDLVHEHTRLKKSMAVDCMIVGCDDEAGPWVPMKGGVTLCEWHYDRIVAHALGYEPGMKAAELLALAKTPPGD
jgi:hypothetical protein